MGNKKSSFHISDEFNGCGEKVCLAGAERKSCAPLSQDNVRLTPDFKQYIPKALGAMPLVETVNEHDNNTLKALGGVASVGQVIVSKNTSTGKYMTSFPVSKKQLTNGSFLHLSQKKEAPFI